MVRGNSMKLFRAKPVNSGSGNSQGTEISQTTPPRIKGRRRGDDPEFDALERRLHEEYKRRLAAEEDDEKRLELIRQEHKRQGDAGTIYWYG
jgi:hypothetical protein